ncbi:MAG TPA: hypothetical protein ENH06_00490 [bacterium]|nr:hypothetical protein [bacterium]
MEAILKKAEQFYKQSRYNDVLELLEETPLTKKCEIARAEMLKGWAFYGLATKESEEIDIKNLRKARIAFAKHRTLLEIEQKKLINEMSLIKQSVF